MIEDVVHMNEITENIFEDCGVKVLRAARKQDMEPASGHLKLDTMSLMNIGSIHFICLTSWEPVLPWRGPSSFDLWLLRCAR